MATTPEQQQADPIIRIYILVIATVFTLVYFRNANEEKARQVKARAQQIADLNTIKTGDWDGIENSGQVTISPYQDLDYMKKTDLLQARQHNALAYRHLLVGGYETNKKLSRAMRDEAPWYGQQGQSCFGMGQNIINGLTEYSQEFLTPLMLLSVKENYFLNVKEAQDCVVLLPQALSLEFNPQFNNAYLTYDMSSYLRERQLLKTNRPGRAPVFTLTNFNAVDFGYQFVSVTEADCVNINPVRKDAFYGKMLALKQVITYTRNCGLEEGCNLVYPYQANLAFEITRVPARLYCRLWKKQPDMESAPPDPEAGEEGQPAPPPGQRIPDEQADFEFIIDFQ